MRFDRFMSQARTTTPAVVIGVFNSTGVGVIRNLSQQGVPVLALDTDPRSAGLLSRQAAHGACPDPHYYEDAFIATLVDIGRRLPRKAVLFPCQDDCVFVTSRRAEQLEPYYLLPFSRWEVMRRLADKEEQIKAAHAACVGTPRTAFLHSREDVERAAHSIPFPAIMKSADHLAMRRRHFGKVVRVDSATDLPTAYARVAECGNIMLQEIIPGGDDRLYTLQSYLDVDHQPLAMFIRHKLRQHPRDFGVCRFGESLWVQDVADQGLALLREIGFHGVSGVEFKRDLRDGQLKLMEVNARHVSWHKLATALGVNFSYVAYSDALGRRIVAPPQIDGPRWIIASRDIPDSLREIVRGELSAREWLTSLKGTRVDGMLSLDDPVPGVYEFARFAWRGVKRRAQKALSADDTWG
jgi:predicted ATP-grasp superfamily ATP-dependent carboligase